MKKLFCSVPPDDVDVLFGSIQTSNGLYVIGHVIVAKWAHLGPRKRQARLTMFEQSRDAAMSVAARFVKGDFEPAMRCSLFVTRDWPKKNGKA